MNKAKKIVLVEDNIGDVKLIEFVLSSLSVRPELLHFDNGKSFLTFVKESSMEDIAVVLLDLNMPVMTGMEVLKALRNDDKGKYLPVVILTSSRSYQDVEACYRLGTNAFVAKPVEFDDFSRSIEAVLQFWLEHNINPLEH
ncbi:MAG: response regulator [Saprospiraceae bacterium]|nr:MAG: response regulator [Saprospiraceae bacterium]